MRLRTRFAIILAGFVLALMGLVAALTELVLVRQAVRTDEDTARKVLERGTLALFRDRAALAEVAGDWSAWEPMRRLASARQPEALDDSTGSILRALRLDLLVVFDADSGILHSEGRHARAAEGEGVATRLKEAGVIPAARRSGYLVVNDALWLAAVAPIADPAGGAILGSVLMGRRVDGPDADNLARMFNESAGFSSVAGEHISGTSHVWSENPGVLLARCVLEDLAGPGGIAIDVRIPRTAFAQNVNSIAHLSGWMLICGAALTLFSLWVLDRWVFRDLVASVRFLMSGIVAIATDQMGRMRLPRRQPDEMGSLAEAVNKALEALEISQRRLRVSESLYRGLVEAAPTGIVSLSPGGSIRSVNKAFLSLPGVGNSSPAVAMPLSSIWPGRVAEAIQARATALADGESVSLEDLQAVIDSQQHWFDVTMTRVGGASREEGFILAIVEETTRRVSAEQEAERRRAEATHAQKLAALGTLVAGVAHEVNNPNGIVSLNMTAVQRQLDRLFAGLKSGAGLPDGPLSGAALDDVERGLREAVAETRAASVRIAEFVASLKRFVQPEAGRMAEQVDVNGAVRRASEWLRHEIQAKACRLELELTADLPAVTGSAQEIQQVFVNLLQNACNAVDRPGSVLKVTSALDAERRAVTISVSDEGRGIRREDMDRVCDPFFTTRRAEGGTGLGLSISAMIVKAHGGRLRVESEEGRGTCVVVTLPSGEEMGHAG